MNKNNHDFHKINSNKKYYTLNNKYFKFCLIFIFANLFVISHEKNEINLIIQGEGRDLNFLNDQFYTEPSEVIVKGNKVNANGKKYNFDIGLNNVTINFENQIESCENMFNGLTNIIEIDLTDLDTSKVTSMASMFSACSNLEKITLSNINTSSVKSMENLFDHCPKLESIDVSNFDTSSVTSLARMFFYCEMLTSINVSNFKTNNVDDMCNIFAFCYKLAFVDVSNFDTSKVKDMQGMFSRNFELKSLDLSNFDTYSVTNMKYMFEQSSYLYLNLYSFIIKDGIPIDFIFKNTPSNLKICINDLNTRNKLASYGKTFDCSDVCINKNLKIDSQYKRCVGNCNETDYKYEYNNTCFNECPNEKYTIDNEYLCLDEKPEGYYLDLDELKYKKCFDRCKNCYGFGDEINNNCSECKSNYILSNGTLYNFLYELNINDYKNCYIKCPYYFYFDKNTSIYFCTENQTCYGTYDKLIYEKDECVNKCEEDDIYKYEFKKRCYKRCSDVSINKNLKIYPPFKI